MSAPRPSEADELAFVVCPDLEHTTHDGHDHCEQVTQRLSEWLAARDAEREREVAALRRSKDALVRQTKRLQDQIARASMEPGQDRQKAVHAYADRADSAERALADLRGEIKAELTSEDAHAVLYGVIGTHPESYGGVTKDEALERAGALIERLRALLPRDDAAGAGGAE